MIAVRATVDHVIAAHAITKLYKNGRRPGDQPRASLYGVTSMDNRDQIYTDISSERDSQDAKWGNQHHSMPVWSAILTEECGEVAEASLQVAFHGEKEHLAHLREELVQVAAVAVHIIEKIDSDDWKRGT